MVKYEYIVDSTRLPQIAQEIANSPCIALDIETAKLDKWRSNKLSGLDPRMSAIRLIQINTGAKKYVIDLFRTGRPEPIIQALNEYTGIVSGQNLKFDFRMLKHHYNIEVKKVFDTFRSAMILDTGKDTGKPNNQKIKHHLWALETQYLGIDHPDTDEDEQKSDWSGDLETGELTQSQKDYAALDVAYIHPLRDVLKKHLAEAGLNRIAQIEFNVIYPEIAMELNGFRVSKEKWLDLARKNRVEAAKLREQLLQELPNPTGQMGLFGAAPWNLDSNQQMLESLRKLGLKTRSMETKKLVPLEGTNELQLVEHAKAFPVVKKLIEYRGISQRVKTFGEDWLRWIHPITGRLHTQYWGYLDSGRYSCRDPMLMNIPREKIFRDCFEAEYGYDLALCVAEGTKVATSAGLKAIETISTTDSAVLEDGTFAPITNLLYKGKQATIRIKTYNGYEIRVTPTHRLRVRDADGEYAWKEAGKLKKGDAVAIQANRGFPQYSHHKSTPDAHLEHNNEKPLSVPMLISEQLAEFLGYETGDGSFGHYSLSAVVCDRYPEVYSWWVSCVKDLFDRPEPKDNAYRGVIEGKVHSLPLLRWLDSMGSEKGKVPDFLWSASEGIVGAYLRGLFEADGSVSRRNKDKPGGESVSFSSANDRLAAEVHLLLLSLGIMSRLTKEKSDLATKGYCWHIRISSYFWKTFQEKIGFRSNFKVDRLCSLVSYADRIKKSQDNVKIPNTRPLLMKVPWTDCYYMGLLNVRAGRPLGLRLAERAVKDDPSLLDKLNIRQTLVNKTYFDTVISTKNGGICNVYDLCVPGPATYIGNGFVNHNCDWSNVEMVLAAEISGDEALLEIFNSGKDAHYETAATMTGMTVDQLKALPDKGKNHRQSAKPCFHPDTEILTREKGWVKVSELTMEDQVASVIPHENAGSIPDTEIVWVKPLRLTQRKAMDGLLYLQNEGISLRVTPDHRMLTYGSTNKLKTVEAKDFGKQRGWFNAGICNSGKINVDSRILRLAVAVQADGTYNGGVDADQVIRLGFSKQRKIERLSGLLHPEEYEVHQHANGKEQDTTCFSLNIDLSHKIKALLDFDKTLPWWWIELTTELRDVVLDEARFWDGHVGVQPNGNKWRMFEYFSSISKNIDVLQAMASITNRKTAQHVQEGRPGPSVRSGQIAPKEGGYDPSYVLSVKPKYHTRGEHLTVTKLDYTGDVVCLTVPSSYVLVRDGGIPVIVGQCNFGFTYSLGADKLILYALMQYGVTMSRSEAVDFRKKWFDKYDGIRRWHERSLREGERSRICRSLMGRRRYMTDKAHGEFFNTPVQGSGADALKIALYNVYHKLKKYGNDAKIVHCVHDEIITETKNDPDIIAGVKKDIHDGMMDGINVMLTRVKASCEATSGHTWASAKG